MKYYYSLMLAAAFLWHPVSAQTIKGTVLDNENKLLEHAVVHLLKAADSSLLRTEVTDTEGLFSFDAGSGSYLLRVTAAGYAEQLRSIEVEKEPVSLAFKLLLPAKLAGVTVIAAKPFIEAKPGMMVVNIEGSPASAGSNALELLQRAPGVQIDPQGNISMRSRTGVQVYIDGRPSRLSGDQLTAYLRSMTAEEIAQLELITQPGSRYEAAGTAGIINIRSRAIRKRGLNANLSATAIHATAPFGNISGRVTYRHNKLTVYASEYFNYVDNHNTLQVNRKYFLPGTNEPAGNVLTDQKLRYNSRFHRIKAGAEYALSRNTTIGLRAQTPIGNPKMDYRNFTTVSDASVRTSYNLGRRNMENDWYEREYGLLGMHRFYDEGELSVDAFYVLNRGADHGLFVNEPTDAAGRATGAPDLWDLSFPVYIRLISAQSDYTRPLAKKTKLESGIKYTNVDIDYSANFRIPDNNGVFIADTLRSTRFLYSETVAAAYTSISHTHNERFEAQAGLRAEQTVANGHVTKGGERFSRTYLSTFPTLFLTYKADSVNTVTFSYGRRLDRPNYHILNPARNYIDKYSYSVGNPRLLPQFHNNFELGYSYKGELTATLSFMQTNGVISDFFVQDDVTKTAYEIHDNIATYRQGGLSVNYNKAIRTWWDANFYADFYLKAYEGNYFGTSYNQQGSSHSCNLTNRFSFARGWNAEANLWYQGSGLQTVFTRPGAMGSVDLGVSKKMLSDSLIVKLAFNDVFGTQRYRASNRFANFDTDVQSTWDARRAVLSLNYSFGKDIALMQRKGEGERRM